MSGDAVTLREITAETVRAICELSTSEAQRAFVAPNAVSIAQAYFDRRAEFRAVYAGEEPVGFVMWRPTEEERTAFVWRLMVDHRYQARGYGREALRLTERELADRGFDVVRLTCSPAAHGPRGFYLGLGFTDTGDRNAVGELIVERPIAPERG